jgi:hypothetical protein
MSNLHLTPALIDLVDFLSFLPAAVNASLTFFGRLTYKPNSCLQTFFRASVGS